MPNNDDAFGCYVVALIIGLVVLIYLTRWIVGG